MKFIDFNWRLITLQYCSDFAKHQHVSATGIHVFPILNSPPRTIPLVCPSAPAPSIQYHALNLGWWLISYMILYMFQCHSPNFKTEKQLCVCVCVCVCVCELVTQLYLTLCDSMNYSPLSFSVLGILQARILEWILTTLTFSSREKKEKQHNLPSSYYSLLLSDFYS